MTTIKFKLLPLIVMGVIALSLIFYGFAVKTQEANLDKVTLDGVQSAKKTFHNLKENDIKMLRAAMVDFMTNQEYKDVFLEGDREKLYNYGQELFATHKAMGITHFYFHRIDGAVFTRLHNPDIYDDVVTRKTFAKSRETESWGAGIELGKTAFALRVVHPYYNDGELIGYIEYGEEIDHFIEIMKEQTGHEYGIIVKKEFIDHTKWASVRDVKGLRNNYDDLQNYVVIDTTKEDASLFLERCFVQDDLDTVPDEGRIFNKFKDGDLSFVCGGFALYDAGDDRAGAVVVIQDVTALVTTAEKNNQGMLIIAIIGAMFIGGAIVFVVTRSVIAPLDKAVKTTKRVAGGDLSAKIEVESDDEIGALAEAFNEMTDKLKGSYSGLEEKVQDRTAQLEEQKEELTGMNEELTAMNEELQTTTEDLTASNTKIRKQGEVQVALNSLLKLPLGEISLEELFEETIDILVSQEWISLESKGAIFLAKGDPPVLKMKAQRGLHEALLVACEEVPFGKCLCGQAASTKEIVTSESLDERHETQYEGIASHGHYCVPIISEGEVLGVINLYVKEGHSKDESETDFLHGVANVLAGIIQRKKAEEALQEYADKLEVVSEQLSEMSAMQEEKNILLEKSIRLKDLFTDIIRHDLLNPIGAANTITGLLLKEENDPRKRGDLNQIRTSLSKGRELIESAKELSKLESVEDIEFDELDLKEIIDGVCKDFAPLLDKAGMEIENKVTQNMPIKGNKVILQVFSNLISNAIKYALEGKNIVIEEEDREGSWRISVIDFGEGIKDEFKEGIFGRLFRKEKKGVKGTGLGLAIVRKIVELHKGKVWVEDNPEGGSIFVVDIPKAI